MLIALVAKRAYGDLRKRKTAVTQLLKVKNEYIGIEITFSKTGVVENSSGSTIKKI